MESAEEAEGGSDPVMDPVTNVFMLVNALNEAYENIKNRKFRHIMAVK